MTGFNSKRDAAADKLQEPVEFDAFLESQDFYELMQTYRHCQIDAPFPFEAVKDALRAVQIEAALAQPAQDPFGYFKAEPFGWTDCAETDEGARALYEAPPKREWVGLTPEETSGFTQHEMTVVKYVSKVLQEKNG
jgi:hypothetical protein